MPEKVISVKKNLIKNRYLIILGLIGGAISYFSPASTFIFLLAFLALYLITRRMEQPEKNFITKFFLIGFALRVGFAILATFFAWRYNLGYKNEFMGVFIPDLVPDSGAYSLRGLLTAQYLHGVLEHADGINPRWLFTVEKPDYSFLIYTTFYFFFGFAQIAVKFFNCLLGVLSSVLIYLIVKSAFNKIIARAAYILMIFFPTIFVWSTTNLKEIPTFFLIASLVFISLKFNQKPKIRYILYSFLPIFLIYQIRNNLFLPVFVSFLSSFFFVKSKTVLRLVIFSLLFILIVKLFGYDFLRIAGDFFPRQLKNMIDFQRGFVSEGGSTYKIYAENVYSGIAGTITFPEFSKALIKGVVYFLFTPFPWRINSWPELISMPVILVWYFLFLCSILGIFITLRYRRINAVIILFYILFNTTSLGLISGNIGTAFRHRDLVLPLYLIFAAVSITKILERKIEIND